MFFFKQVSWAFLLFLCFQLSIANASSVQQVSIDDMLDSAELVFEGRVTKVESRWNSNRSAINTLVTFDVLDVIHGSTGSSAIELSFAGGSVDELTMQVHGMVYPEVGEQGIYFIEDTGRVQVNPIVGWSQGHFLVDEDASGEQRMLTAGRKPITEMTDESAPAQAISEGVAAGVRVNANRTNAVVGMSKSQFKQALQAKLLNRSAR